MGACDTAAALVAVERLALFLVGKKMQRMVTEDLRGFLARHDVDSKLRRLIYYTAVTCKYINSKIKEANRKFACTKNCSGDQQFELDKEADMIFTERMRHCPYVKELASEEQENIVCVEMPEQSDSAEYCVTVDPFDGGTVLDVNFAIGTIVGIYRGKITLDKPQEMVAAMYVLYGPLTTLVLSTGRGTHEFVLNPEGEFILSLQNIRMNDKGKIYSIGGLRKDWITEHQQYIKALENEGYKLRVSGCLCADFNQILMKKGGVFTYPGLVNKPEGQLRLLYELQPLAFIMENAGGMATDGKMRILEIVPNTLHQRSPIYIGSKYEIELAKKCLSKKDDN